MGGIDPLRTFSITEDEWAEVVEGVKGEGFDDWDGYAPAIIAAIELGYLDRHLQMLGKWMRARYTHLRDSSPEMVMALYTPGAAVGKAAVAKTLIDKLLEDSQHEIPMIPTHGVTPIGKAENLKTRLIGQFQARGYVFDKDDFVGKHFVSPVPIEGGALYRIDKVNSVNFQVRCVAVNDKRQERKLNREYAFTIERQHRMYNLPKDADA
jgi:hypothetical protein